MSTDLFIACVSVLLCSVLQDICPTPLETFSSMGVVVHQHRHALSLLFEVVLVEILWLNLARQEYAT